MLIREIFKDIHKGVRIENNTKNFVAAYVIDTANVENCIINYKKREQKQIYMDIKDKYYLKNGDIIIASIPTETTNHVGYCENINDDKVIIKKNFFILRNPLDPDLYNLEFLAEYLDLFGVEQIKKNHLNGFGKQDIENIYIPDISREKQNKLVNLIKKFKERIKSYNNLIENDKTIKKYIINEMINNEE